MKNVGTWRAMSALTMMISTFYNQCFGILTWHAMSLLTIILTINFH